MEEVLSITIYERVIKYNNSAKQVHKLQQSSCVLARNISDLLSPDTSVTCTYFYGIDIYFYLI